MTAKTTTIIAVSPIFLNQVQAGKYLGHSYEWLRLRAARHTLYRPSDGKSKAGVASKYHQKHLELICLHLLDPELFTEDIAYRAWCTYRDNLMRQELEAISATTARRKKV